MRETGRLRRRAIWIGILGVVPLTLFVQWSDLIVGGTIVAGPFPPLAASLFFASLAAGNALLSRTMRRPPPLERRELLLILAVWLVANMVAGRGLLHPFLASMAGPTYYANTPAMQEMVANNVPAWLAVTDRDAARGFLEGRGRAVPWALWWRPLLTWTLFFVPFVTANLCLCALFERVWVREERLTFPLVALPLEMVGFGPDGGAGARGAFWIGLAIPTVFHGLGVANAYWPGVPYLPLSVNLSEHFANYPWNVLRPVYLSFFPILVGLTFLAPTDVTLGVWFFLLVNKAQMLIAATTGWAEGPITYSTRSAPPYIEEQSAGAYLALAAIVIGNARNHLGKIGAAMIAPGQAPAEYRDLRLLGWGFVCGGVGILAWSVATGLPAWFAALYFAFYFAVALVLGRLMAEGGVAWILAPILPDKLLLSAFGTSSLPPVALTRLAFAMQHLRDTRQMLAPAVGETGKLRDILGYPPRRFYGLLLAAVGLALVVGAWRALSIFYDRGALSLIPNNDGLAMSVGVIASSGIRQAAERLQTPVGWSSSAGIAALLGALVATALNALRLRTVGWPLHPLGYALTGTLQLGYANQMLFSIFLGWAFKALVQRFGGMSGYRSLRGTAFGMIVGDLLLASVVKVLDALLGPSAYAIF